MIMEYIYLPKEEINPEKLENLKKIALTAIPKVLAISVIFSLPFMIFDFATLCLGVPLIYFGRCQGALEGIKMSLTATFTHIKPLLLYTAIIFVSAVLLFIGLVLVLIGVFSISFLWEEFIGKLTFLFFPLLIIPHMIFIIIIMGSNYKAYQKIFE